ncbi:MAG: hypothetical protein O9972_49025 [Burkholderiales bacterium]|nr:hypothetical protein [Burkholderiales bacterium]
MASGCIRAVVVVTVVRSPPPNVTRRPSKRGRIASGRGTAAGATATGASPPVEAAAAPAAAAAAPPPRRSDPRRQLLQPSLLLAQLRLLFAQLPLLRVEPLALLGDPRPQRLELVGRGRLRDREGRPAAGRRQRCAEERRAGYVGRAKRPTPVRHGRARPTRRARRERRQLTLSPGSTQSATRSVRARDRMEKIAFLRSQHRRTRVSTRRSRRPLTEGTAASPPAGHASRAARPRAIRASSPRPRRG